METTTRIIANNLVKVDTTVEHNGQTISPLQTVAMGLRSALERLGARGARVTVMHDCIDVRVEGQMFNVAVFDGPMVTSIDTRPTTTTPMEPSPRLDEPSPADPAPAVDLQPITSQLQSIFDVLRYIKHDVSFAVNDDDSAIQRLTRHLGC